MKKSKRKNKTSTQVSDLRREEYRKLNNALHRGDYVTFLLLAFHVARKVVKLDMPTDAPGILVKCKDMNEKMTANAVIFVTPPIILATNLTHINTAFAAEAAMEDPDTDKTNTRDQAIAVILREAFSYRDYVQTLVTASPASADAIAIAAGMSIKGFGKRGKQIWAVKYTGISQEVELQGQCKAQRCSYEWQRTETPENLPSWRVDEITSTLQSTTIVTGLTVGKNIWFRYRIILKDGPTEWSNPIKVHII